MTPDQPSTPALRFSEFTDPWAPSRGGDAFIQGRQRGEDGLPIYSVTIEGGMVRRDSLDREISSNAADGANLRANKDDMVYNMMRMWQGAVGRAPVDCMVSPAYVVLVPKLGTLSQFFEHWFKRSRSIYWLWAYSYGLTGDRLRLYFRDFTKVPMSLPSFDEQQKIADFFGAIDERAELLSRRLDALLRYKRGTMQQIFSRTLRFKRANGSEFPDWEEIRLGDIAEFAKGRGISKEDIVAGGKLPCIRYGELYTIYGERIKTVVSATDAAADGLLMSKPGDVILPASGETPLDMPSASCVLIGGVALGGDLNVIRSSINGVFLAYLLRSHKRREVARLAQGNSIVHLYGTHLASLKLAIPTDPDEQQNIADFLGAVDDKIAAVSARIDAMQTFKKGLLQQMFV
ncbi:restriction endonuclease subunit S [Mesorhizobium sp. M0142]|uniref:restriction endonuclease subunit S n=1 Tax=unclassified Mesorhizobium TaxID=325217 RepID=UPI003339829A